MYHTHWTDYTLHSAPSTTSLPSSLLILLLYPYHIPLVITGPYLRFCCTCNTKLRRKSGNLNTFLFGPKPGNLQLPILVRAPNNQLMSTASKITLGTSIAFAIGSFVFINYSQQTERQGLREGPIKDAKRIEEKRKKLMRNSLEHEEQKQLKEQFEKVQPLTGEIISGPAEGST